MDALSVLFFSGLLLAQQSGTRLVPPLGDLGIAKYTVRHANKTEWEYVLKVGCI